LARISVHDTVLDGRTVEAVLRQPDAVGGNGLRDLVLERTHKG